MKLIVAGGRDFNDYELLRIETMRFILENNGEPGNIQIISGKARGADTLGERFAKEWGFPVIEMPAKWDDFSDPRSVVSYRKDGSQYNGAAGPIRNEEMAKIATHCICFFNGSKGTANMIENAKKHKIIFKIVEY